MITSSNSNNKLLVPLLMSLSNNSSNTIKNNEIENGLDFILNHFDQNRLFPRTIMTKKLGYQKEVFSKEEAMKLYEESDFIDCRINAFPSYTYYKGIQRYPPDLIFIDIDKKDFKTSIGFEVALSTTLKKIKEKFGNDAQPTVLFTGGGYHIYQPVYCPTVLENVTEFQKFDKPSQEFLRFAKDNLSNGKADKNNNPSFKSCLLRIPESINSKYNIKITIVQRWIRVRQPIRREFIEEFRTHLIQKKIDEYRYRQKILKARRYTNNDIIFWIEKLLNISLGDFRKNTLNLILAPYLIHIKKLSYQESFEILIEWLRRCNSIRKLDFNSSDQVKTALNITIQKRIPPMKLETLKNRNFELYNKFYK